MKNYPFSNFAELGEYVARTYNNPTAFNYKDDGQWKSISTREFINQVKYLALALHELGVKKGEAVGILAFPSPFWLMADLAILSIGAVTIPFFPPGSEGNLEFKIENSRLKQLFLFCPDAWERVAPHLGSIQNVICQGFMPDDKKIISFEDFIKRGMILEAQQPDIYQSRQKAVQEKDLASIIYTSGSTGMPKGVVLTHKNVISQLKAARQIFPLDSLKDVAVSCLPLAHSFEHTIVYYYIASGVSIYFNSDIKKLGDDLKEVRPTTIVVVPRIFEKIYAKIKAKVAAASAVEKIIGAWAIEIANKHDPDRDRQSLQFMLAKLLVFKKLMKALGGRLRFVITGGAPFKRDLYRFFINIGVPLYQGYGLTEAAPILSANYPGNHKLGTVGKAFPDVTLKIDSTGEVLARGPNIMRSYHEMPEETNKMIDADGWLHTGDLGVCDSEGYLTITGRKKELLKTSGGKYVSPIPIEQELCASSLIDMALVIGEGQSFVSALLFPDPEYFKKWKKTKEQSEQDFLASPFIKKKIESLIEAINSRLDHWQQIKEYRFILDPISVESGELTPTLKIKRHVIVDRYKELIAEIYREK